MLRLTKIVEIFLGRFLEDFLNYCGDFLGRFLGFSKLFLEDSWDFLWIFLYNSSNLSQLKGKYV
jgi:hypothetical protein